MTGDDEALRRAYEAALEARRYGPEPDVPLEALVRLVEGEGPEGERLATLDAALADPRTRHELDLLRAAAAGAAQGRVGNARFPGPTTLVRWAALIVVGMGLGTLWLQLRPGASPMRSVDDAALELTAPEPGQTVGPRPEFVWRSVPGARGYVLEVLTVAGDAAVRTETPDTTWTPDAGTLAGGEYRWWVIAELAGGLQSRADPRAFTVRSP